MEEEGGRGVYGADLEEAVDGAVEERVPEVDGFDAGAEVNEDDRDGRSPGLLQVTQEKREEDVDVGRRPAQAPSVESACSIQIEVLIGVGLPANLGGGAGHGLDLGSASTSSTARVVDGGSGDGVGGGGRS